ncbi:ribonuclease HIII [Leuconostoc lactis]|uniref:AFWIR motif membrane protein n=1 Tax=Leuconostoc lactis TaxID=1246 RepID=UPI00272A30CB|nr:ribonuclease HIII [Leuconostoc lactis]WKY79525.1 ribonuclease HIII [Leuconostoc lactis]
MLSFVLIPFIIIFLGIYFIAFLFTNTFGIIPRLLLAIVLILVVSFVIKNFFAIVGLLLLFALAFWIRIRFIKPPRAPEDPNTFEGDFEEINKKP